MEVSRGEMSDLVAKDLSKNAGGRRRELSREANDPTAYVNSAKGSTKPTTPLDTYALLQASQTPPSSPLLKLCSLLAHVARLSRETWYLHATRGVRSLAGARYPTAPK